MEMSSDTIVPIAFTTSTPELTGFYADVHSDYMADMLMQQSMLFAGLPSIKIRERDCPFDAFWVDIRQEKIGNPFVDALIDAGEMWDSQVSVITEGEHEVVRIRTKGPYIVCCYN